jgi:transposase
MDKKQIAFLTSCRYVDVGIKVLATPGTGETIANPRQLNRPRQRLVRLQRAVSRQKNGSANSRKAIQNAGQATSAGV